MLTQTIGFAICGSFCCFHKIFPVMRLLIQDGWALRPILSPSAWQTNTRFGEAASHVAHIEEMCGVPVVKSIVEAEAIGPGRLLDALVVAPCTGNTLGKLAAGITDTPVTMAVKAQLRNQRPVVIGLSTNDGLGASAAHIGRLLNVKHIYFVPFGQDDSAEKPRSLVADFTKIPAALACALQNEQIQPILL
jgi:dipicolinate synthase subunit B